jgi:transforming growth factor-beta-induced protein
MRRTLIAIMAFSLMLVSALPAAAAPNRGGPPTIASTAIAADDFDTLVTALLCTGNEGLLAAASSPRSNLTVFAPTDAAFAHRGITPANVCAVSGLSEILADHIVPGRYVEGRVLNSTTLTSLGGPLSVADDIAPKLVATNIQTANGVIHVINDVILVSN